MQRRNRLSRSRDFDAVYRQGRSASTRFLVLYWFARDEVERVPSGRDYVLIAKPGLSEAIEANGFAWLGERVDEVLSKAPLTEDAWTRGTP